MMQKVYPYPSFLIDGWLGVSKRSISPTYSYTKTLQKYVANLRENTNIKV